MKTVAALANAEGGTLLFVIDNDGAVVGLGIDDTRKLLDCMTQLIRDWVRPHVDFDSRRQSLFIKHEGGHAAQ